MILGSPVPLKECLSHTFTCICTCPNITSYAGREVHSPLPIWKAIWFYIWPYLPRPVVHLLVDGFYQPVTFPQAESAPTLLHSFSFWDRKGGIGCKPETKLCPSCYGRECPLFLVKQSDGREVSPPHAAFRLLPHWSQGHPLTEIISQDQKCALSYVCGDACPVVLAPLGPLSLSWDSVTRNCNEVRVSSLVSMDCVLLQM